MSRLLAIESFPGRRVGSAEAAASFVAEAEFDGAIVCTYWPRSEVAGLLPAGLSLGHNASSEPELHPVLFVLGTQKNAGLLVGGVSVPTGVAFSEVMIAVPFVCRAEGGSLHILIPRIYSADRFSTWSGNANYGFNKQLADMGWLGRTFTISARGGPLLAHAIVEDEGAWEPVGDLPGLTAVANVFRLPALGRRSDGREVCSYFDWQFSAATARAVKVVIAIDASLGAGLDPRVCHGVQSGTFEVRRMRWRVSWPGPCRF